MKRSILGFTGFGIFFLFLMFAACGKSTNNKIQQAERMADSLRAIGVPDSLLTDVDVMVFQAKTNKERSRGKEASKAADSALILVRIAQKNYESVSSEAVRSATVLLDEMEKKLESLSGLRRETLAQGLKAIDSLMKSKLLLQASALTSEMSNLLPTLLEDEVLTKKNTPLVVGAWARETIEKDNEVGTNSKEIEKYEFSRDGKFVVNESKKGNYDKKIFLDYSYISTGNYVLNGDTVKMYVKHIKGYNHNKVLVDEAANKWKQVEEAPFDSSVTDGKQDRFQTYSLLKQHFKRK